MSLLSDKTPCIVITRDRVSMTRQCVASLERFQDRLDIHIVDHGSTYEPMLDYLAGCPHPVHMAGDNPPRALWDGKHLPSIVGTSRYLVTDPDLIFDQDCPSDWLTQLDVELACGYPALKIGMGLRTDDLPNTYLARSVRTWEAPFWHTRGGPHTYIAPVDTTLALHLPLVLQRQFVLTPAARLAPPYLMRHLPWYALEGEPETEEAAYYRTHVLEGASHWVNGGWG